LPGSLCHCRCYAIALHSVAVVAVAVVTLPPARHAGAARSNSNTVSPEKCIWRAQEVEFLGYVIGREGIKMSNDKVQAVLSWKIPKSLTEVQLFLGFANFYRRFI